MHRPASAASLRSLLSLALVIGVLPRLGAAGSETLLADFLLPTAAKHYGPPALAGFDPQVAPQRDPALWPRGYYPGDPLPPKTIYLSFDDGPWDFTGDIVEILHEEGVRATFFMNAYDKDQPLHANTKQNLLLRYADVLKRLVADGNIIGNHTYSHQDLARLSPAQIDFQLSTLQRQLTEVLGDQMPQIRLIRPPFGSPWLGGWNSPPQRKKVADALAQRGLVMLWSTGWDSSDSVDWAPGEWFESASLRYHPGTTRYQAKMIRELARILRHADGVSSGIILMHDTHPTSRDILKPLIEELKRRGYRFATLEDYCRWRWGPAVFDSLGTSPKPAAAAEEPIQLPGAEGKGRGSSPSELLSDRVPYQAE